MIKGFEFTHYKKPQGNTFTDMCMGQRPDRNHDCEFVITHDPWISPTKLPAGPETGMGSGIGPQLGKINRAPK